MDVTTALLLVFLLVVLIGGGVALQTQRRRASAGSYERLRAAVDTDRIKAIKAADGDVKAVHAVRRAHPDASLEDAVRLVKVL